MKLTLPKKGVDIYHIAGDFHDINYCKASFNILLKHALMLPKARRKLIINGDFLDCPEFMPKSPLFQTWIKRAECLEEFFLPAIAEGAEWGNHKLDILQKVFPLIILVAGNHEVRIEEFRVNYVDKKWPAYSRNFYLNSELKVQKRGIETVKYNDWIDIGNVSITHGMYHGATCLKKHYEASGKSVIFNHVHTDEVKSFIRRGNSCKAYSNPAMCDLNPDYIKNRETNWTKGFGILRVKPNGNFNYTVNTIWDGELVLESGKILKG